ncbi:sulfatase [Cellulophaga sp. F20128]|uniref:sulfatase family protein n=1 Tax=Cellulophaga sp. F20128 TaxID=2926413 RepID=UPI001FF103DA|nr:sulfatase [Cellulophaga sp. F20128]MCK0156825.1 sulfatase [Cellulophaga sp. F20128]
MSNQQKKKRAIIAFFTALIFGVTACNDTPKTKDKLAESTVAKDKPNILWLYLEDTAPLLSCYGTSLIATPHIDSLAQQGVLFKNVFMPAPVCSAVRSSIITGVMATTTGTQNHHSSRTLDSGIELPEGLATIPALFKKEGYFTFNNGKDDYNFLYERKDLYDQEYTIHPLYGKSGVRLPIASLKDQQPFFGQIQLYGGKEIFSSSFKENVKSPVDRSKFTLPPYLPNHPVLVEEYAAHLEAIQITDEKVGQIMRQLKANNLLENTIVFFFSDHGMRITRNKQFLYDGGLQVPLIIADFTKQKASLPAGTINEDLIAGLDLGTTALALAGIEIPANMEGKNMLAAADQRKYVISTRDRCDFTIDRIRSVRSKEYKYIRNFMTDRPYSQPTYMDVDGIEFIQVMHQLHKDNKLNAVQDRFMANERPAEELYDLKADPFELNNLAGNSAYTTVLQEYATVLENWITTTGDKGQYPEDENNLKLMLGIWGKHCVNPEYDALREKFPDLAGSWFYLKREKSVLVDSTFTEAPLFNMNLPKEEQSIRKK